MALATGTVVSLLPPSMLFVASLILLGSWRSMLGLPFDFGFGSAPPFSPHLPLLRQGLVRPRLGTVHLDVPA